MAIDQSITSRKINAKSASAYRAAFTAMADVVRTDRRAKIGLGIVAFAVFMAIFGQYITPYPTDVPETAIRLQGPSWAHPFGTDVIGRDQLSRIMAGVRISMVVAAGAVIMALVAGLLLGAVSGFAGGVVDSVIMRIMDAIIAFPGRLLAIALVVVWGASIQALWFAIAFSAVPQYARLIRGSVLSQKEREYVEAARSVGESPGSMLFRYVLPNSMTPVLVRVPLNFGQAIIAEAGLSFLGLGLVPQTISWGQMLSASQDFIETSPHLMIFPGLALSIVILGFVLLGDALRERLDPRSLSRRRR